MLSENGYATGVATLGREDRRLDAFHHVGFVREGLGFLNDSRALKDVADVLRPPQMKRQRVEAGGIEFLNGADLHRLEIRAEFSISMRTPSIEKFIVQPNTVLFQCVGQRYGIFGRPVLANRHIVGKAVTEAVMRVIPHDPRSAGYISVYFATQPGRRAVLAPSAGTSIPVTQETGAKRIRIYWPSEQRRNAISRLAEDAWESRCCATEIEGKAISMVETAIKEGC